jgi:transposase
MLADALGRPVRMALTPGQAGDVVHAASLLQGQTAGHVIADRAYDAAHFRAAISEIGAVPVIPAQPTRKHPARHDPVAYKLRNRIERLFGRLKRYRRVATRYDRRAIHFLGALHLVAALEWVQ